MIFQSRKTVGRMKTEHSIFIPVQLMKDQAEETTAFIKAARAINNDALLGCPVLAERKTDKSLSGPGIEFIFSFDTKTDFDSIIREIETRLGNS
ncbi:hypothetical protein CPT_Moonbeam31 [Bacillus phage Moonbeam]|uniref:Uncharacterized protein n=1 Tax=Bacillus phage Moonbeam TaxID=1540091 RepID=A0A0A0RP71_9CAUD|nr:hypothetical protein CPT_Moonbeam31 [Bacillus phage Moonbeam]AIW03429.1 hypothetical protein CPT_Moonbeam31 [Bacillus phage Moonbeam]